MTPAPLAPRRAAKPENVLEAESKAKVKIGGDKPGWQAQGEGRAIAKTHDNSI